MEAREVGENVKINETPICKPPINKFQGTAASLLAQESRSPQKSAIRCAYCNELHHSASCNKVVDINIRKQILRRDNQCFVCLRKNHRGDQCEPSKRCCWCNGKHHQFICPVFKPTLNPTSNPPNPPNHLPNNSQGPHKDPSNPNNQIPESTQGTHVVNTTTTISNVRRQLLLQTATTYVQSTNEYKLVKARILLDSGSQHSYITNSLKSKLSLVPLKRETLNLNTFGDKQFSKQQCDIVQVSLQGKNGCHSISALCFPKICSPLSTAIDVD